MEDLTDKIAGLEARDNERARLVHNLKVSLNIETLLQSLGISFSWKDYEKPMQLSIQCTPAGYKWPPRGDVAPFIFNVSAIVFEGERIALPVPIPMSEWSANYRAR